MRVLLLFGSPRKKGNTASLLHIFEEELKKTGTDISYFDVYDQRILGCKACLGCQKDKENICCVIRDDMQPILSEIATSDAIVIAAPIYAWSVPAPMKAVIDRMIYSTCKFYGDDPHGNALMKGKRLYLITTCGYPIEKGTDLYIEAMKRFCKHCGLTFGGVLAERHRNLKEPFMSPEKEENARSFATKLQSALTEIRQEYCGTVSAGIDDLTRKSADDMK